MADFPRPASPETLEQAHVQIDGLWGIITELKEQNDGFEEQIDEFQEQVRELSERLGKSSRNSSRVPSSDSPSQRDKRSKKLRSTRDRQGAQHPFDRAGESRMAFFRTTARLLTGAKPAAPVADLLEQESSWDPSTSWYSSEEEELEERAQEQVWESLEDAKVSTRNRRVLFPDGLRLTLPQAIGYLQRIHDQLSIDTVEGAMLEWLEENTAPENVTQKQMDAHDKAIELWIEEYWKTQNQKLENS